MLDSSPELLSEILGLFDIPLAFPSDHLPDRATLLACSLVCKSWSPHAQRLLFRRVSVDNEWAILDVVRGVPRLPQSSDEFASFFKIVTGHTAKSRWLARNVRSLVLRPHSSTKMQHILLMLTSLRNLRDLDISSAVCRFGEAEFRQLRNSGLSIRSLRINADQTGPRTAMGRPAWLDVTRFIAALPTIQMLDVTANDYRTIPDIPSTVTQPLGLGLVAFQFHSERATDTSTFISTLTQGRRDRGTLQLYHQTLSKGQPENLHVVLAGCGRHLRSISVPGELEDPHVLHLCTHLERFECQALPSGHLVPAIPRTITTLAVTNPRGPHLWEVSYTPVGHLTQQLDTFPNLQVMVWAGSDQHPGFAALKARCGDLGIELRLRALDSPSDDDILFALRRKLL
ncbi:hypothetical protein C8R47DRAFT_1322127 [Mycena vitilis]|nr:hypothetical protein C8R47DRAFT_1322127 [Mycena vitilis]